ncbi:MAG TPA: hypothetical protein GXZ98_04985 [Firmicutes bacterium]|jgi:ATPase subunit of ABC transporter with duplicated ATPase domains|nr:hypothetical protein [Bacillota bacterium]
MIGPLDTQVLVNRTLEVQRIQGNANQVLQDEEQNQKNRLDNQIRTGEQRVQRKSETVQGRIQEQGKHGEGQSRQKKEEKAKKRVAKERRPEPNRNEWRGRFVDIEL